jgi:hypothetical protein
MFGLIRGDQRSRIIMDEHGRHGAMASTREVTKGGEVTKGLHSFKQDMKLHDERIIDIKPEPWWNGPTVVMPMTARSSSSVRSPTAGIQAGARSQSKGAATGADRTMSSPRTCCAHVRQLAQGHGDLSNAGHERRLHGPAEPVLRLFGLSR